MPNEHDKDCICQECVDEVCEDVKSHSNDVDKDHDEWWDLMKMFGDEDGD